MFHPSNVPMLSISAVDFGMPMGPVELADSVGLDVALHVAKILAPVIRRGVAVAIREPRKQRRRATSEAGDADTAE